MIWFLRGCLSTLFFTPFLFAAAFSTPEGLINIPKADFFTPGHLEYGLSGGMNSIQQIEFDIKLNYNISDRLKSGILLVNYNRVVVNLHGTFTELEKPIPMRLAGGILNLSSDTKLTTWDNVSAAKLTNLAHYFVASFPRDSYTLHFGIGKKKFIEEVSQAESVNSAEEALDRLDTQSKPFIGTFFFGMEKPFFKGTLMMEYDGSYLNFGYRRDFDDASKAQFGLTEFGSKKSTLVEVPTRFFSFGYSAHKNVFNIYEDQIRGVKKRIKSFRSLKSSLAKSEKDLKAELVRVQRVKESLIQELQKERSGSERIGASAVKDTVYSKSQVMAFKYYNQAFDLYQNNDNLGAISKLTQAINLESSVPAFYIERGSVYYKLGQYGNALSDYVSAKRLSPNHPQLRNLPPRVQKMIDQEALKVSKY